MFIKLKNKQNQSIYFEGHICDKLPLKNEVDKQNPRLRLPQRESGR